MQRQRHEPPHLLPWSIDVSPWTIPYYMRSIQYGETHI
jgi:hypothetical protein